MNLETRLSAECCLRLGGAGGLRHPVATAQTQMTNHQRKVAVAVSWIFGLSLVQQEEVET